MCPPALPSSSIAFSLALTDCRTQRAHHGRSAMRAAIIETRLKCRFIVQNDNGLRWNFVANQAVSLASILPESSQARRTVAGG